MAKKKEEKKKRYYYDAFQWSEDEYELKDFVDRYSHHLPFLILVTEGYMGRDEWLHGLASDEPYWLHEIAKQPRIVVRSQSEKYYSIPVLYKDEVVPTKADGTEGPPMKISEMMKEPWKTFRFVDDHSRSTYNGPNTGYSIKFGTMEIMDTYEERFLAVHTVLTSGSVPDPRRRPHGDETMCTSYIYPKFTLIPVYMPIGIAVGITMVESEGSDTTFYRVSLEMKKYADSCEHDYTEFFTELAGDILVFEGRPTGDYEYIHFNQYTKKDGKKIMIDDDDNEYATVDDQRSPKSQLSVIAGPAPKRPPRPKRKNSADVTKPQAIGKFVKKLVKKKSEKQKPTEEKGKGLNKAKAPDPEDSSYSEDSDCLYEDPDVVQKKDPNKFYPSELKDRVGPVAVGRVTEDCVRKLKLILQDGCVPAPELPKGPLAPVIPNLETDVHRSVPLPKKNEILKAPPKIPQRDPDLPRLPPTEWIPGPAVKPRGESASKHTRPIPKLNVPRTGYENSLPEPKSKRKIIPDRIPYEIVEPHVSMVPESQKPLNPKAIVKPTPRLPKQIDYTKNLSKPGLKSDSSSFEKVPKKQSTLCALKGIGSADEIPTNITQFTVDDVSRCLELLNLSKHSEDFKNNFIDGRLLQSLDEDVLMEQFNLNRLDAIRLAKFSRDGWRPKLK